MHPRLLRPAPHICLRCQLRLSRRLQHAPQLLRSTQLDLASGSQVVQRRNFNVTAITRSQAVAELDRPTPTFDPSLIPRNQDVDFRGHLKQWQDQYGGPSEEVLSAFGNHPAHGGVRNQMSKLSPGFKSDEVTEQNRWDREEDGDDEELLTIGLFLKPGDVVELSQASHEPTLAVFVQQIGSDSQFFSANGRWCHARLPDIAFAITGCIDPSQLQPLVPYLPTSPGEAQPKGEVHVPPEFGAPVQHMLKHIAEEAERVYRANAPVLDSAYSSLADDQRTRMMTLRHIAKSLLAQDDPSWEPSPAALIATRKALIHDQFRFNSDRRSHRLTNVFAIRPRNEVNIIYKVHGWFREYQEHQAQTTNTSSNRADKLSHGARTVVDFIQKAQKIVSRSRKDREPNDTTIGPSKSRLADASNAAQISSVQSDQFSSTDKQIIKFLQAYVLTDQFRRISALEAASVGLIMATGCYQPESLKHTGQKDEKRGIIDRGIGYVFLQELGVISPFENPSIYDEQLMLPTVRSSINIDLLYKKAAAIQKKPDFRDSMADLRRDLGSTTIYCIDDPGAQEIDDGISIERVNGSASDLWIHVHVANPTAFFDKTHVLSGLAAHMTETLYTPERSYPMLPTWVTQGHFSLKSDRPVLTFSARINAEGEVLEKRIQPGIARKIKTLTPSDVSTILEEREQQSTIALVVGSSSPVDKVARTTPEVDSRELQDLQDMYTAAKALWTRRKAAGAVHRPFSRDSVRVFENHLHPGLSWSPPSVDYVRLTKGDPTISLASSSSNDLVSLEIDSRDIVAEIMMLACQTAAAWCAERAIPVVFRGTVPSPMTDGDSVEEFRARYILPSQERFGKIPRKTALEYLALTHRAIAHSAPMPHRGLGLPSYVKVTSPLRRFSDMIAHWQIEAALRDEASTGRKFDEANELQRRRLPFNQRQIQESIITLWPRETIIRGASRRSSRFWACLAMLRALYYKESPLPDTFRFMITELPAKSITQRFSNIHGSLCDYGLRAQLTNEPSDIELGDEWEVRIKTINVFSGYIAVEPVRLIDRENLKLV